MKEAYDKTPFKEPLVPFSDSETLFTFKRNKNFVIRKEHVESKKGYPLYDIDIMNALLKNFEDDFGISVVPFNVTVGLDDKNQITAFIIAEKIEGKCLSEASVGEKEAKKFFSSLLEYHIDIFENGGFLIYDLNDDDFSYGHTRKDTMDKIYFTDLDCFYEFIPYFNPDCQRESYMLNLETLNSLLFKLEKLGHNLSDLRKKFIGFLEKIKSSFHPIDRETIELLLNQNQKLITEGMEEG